MFITGADPKKVLIRGIGPTLGNFGVGDALADPILELHDSDGGLLASNDNWKSDQQAEIEATMLQPTDDLESAPSWRRCRLLGRVTPRPCAEKTTLPASAWSKPTTSMAPLIRNSGTSARRGFVNTGDNVLIGGFIIDGGPGHVIVRAIGPSLTAFGVTGALQDPTLELHDGNGVLLSSDDNWKESQQAEIAATGLQPSNDLESAIVATLPPGGYTAIVRGKNDTTGVGLLEIYSLN